jgi:hypothetical protein
LPTKVKNQKIATEAPKRVLKKGVDRRFIKHEIVPSGLFGFIKKNKVSYVIKTPAGMRRNGSRPPTILGCGRFDIHQKKLIKKVCWPFLNSLFVN